MAMAHSRKITIDGTTYEWKVRGGQHTPESSPRLRLTVRSPAGAFLQVNLKARRTRDEYDDGDEQCVGKATLSPSDVVEIIRKSIASGWNPSQKTGEPFVPPVRFELTDYESA